MERAKDTKNIVAQSRKDAKKLIVEPRPVLNFRLGVLARKTFLRELRALRG